MKKIIALVLALALVLTAVCALADNSKQTTGGGGSSGGSSSGSSTVVTEEPVITIKFVKDTDKSAAVIKAFKDAYDKGDVLSVLPDDIKAQIGEGQVNINEMLTAAFDGDVSKITKDVVMTVKFETLYKAGEQVTVLLAILKDPVEWHTFKGVGLADGSVQFTIPKAIFDAIQKN